MSHSYWQRGMAEVLRDLRSRRVSAVLVSASRCPASEMPRAMRVVREFPRIPALVLVSRHATPNPSELLALGNCGMQKLIDVRAPGGWERLRETLSTSAMREPDERAMHKLLSDLAGASRDMVQFMEALFAGYSGTRTVRDLANALGVLPSTLVSRFYRAGLPAPKRYLALSGLVRAARLLENPGFSIADVANHLAHSSPQSFARHVRTYVAMSAGDFRKRYDGSAMMSRFRQELITPYANQLRALSPLVMRLRTAARQPEALRAEPKERAREAPRSTRAR